MPSVQVSIDDVITALTKLEREVNNIRLVAEAIKASHPDLAINVPQIGQPPIPLVMLGMCDPNSSS